MPVTFKELAEQRYSLRKFSSATVEPEKIRAILEAGRLAPTAHNLQPQRIKLIEGAETLEKLDLATACRYDAPLAMLVCYDSEVAWRRPDGFCSGDIDATIVATHLMFRATELGLGSCWVLNVTSSDILREQFALPENIIPSSIIMLGYPAEGARPSHLHLKRNPVESFLI